MRALFIDHLRINFPQKNKYPALSVSIYCLIACALYYSFHPIFLLPLPLLLLTQKKYLILPSLAVSLLFYLQAVVTAPSSFPKNQPMKGVAYFSINSAKKQTNYDRTMYKGVIRTFYGDQKLRNIPCTISIKDEPPKPNRSYWIKGTLEQKDQGLARFKPSNHPWKPISYTYSLTALRMQCKTKVSQFIHNVIHNEDSAFLLTALTTGELEDDFLRFSFNRCGLQHLLVISGFHFAALLFFLKILLRFFLPRTILYWTLITIATFYYQFIGDSPSIQRAYIASLLYLYGKWKNYQTNGLNLLSVTMMIELFISPQRVLHPGFQLTFGCTLAILLMYSPIERYIQRFLPKRSKKEIHKLTPLDQLGAYLSAFLRKALALSFSVHLFTLPIIIYLFGTFSPISLIFNLFIPLGITLIIGAFLIALFLYPIPFLSLPFFAFANHGSALIIQGLEGFPPSFLTQFEVPPFPLPLLITILTLLFFFFLTKKENKEQLQFN